MLEFYKQKPEAVLRSFEVRQTAGLSTKEAGSRLKKHGKNTLETGKKINPFRLFVGQFNDALVIVLLMVTLVSLGFSLAQEHGGIGQPLLIFALVVAVVFVGFANEYRVEKTEETLKNRAGWIAWVRRDGNAQMVSANLLVPGDVILLQQGARVPADMRLFKAKNLIVDEVKLTGETALASKNAHTLSETSNLSDQKNMLFFGTIITGGTAEGVVVATASNTEMSKVASTFNPAEEVVTPMQKKLDVLGRKLGAVILGVSIFIFVALFFADKGLQDESTIQRFISAFTVAIALAVAVIPEGLAFVARISLAQGARRMATKNVLVSRLGVVEALGSIDVICTDKSGVLTSGKMAVGEIYCSGQNYSVAGSRPEQRGGFSLDGKEIENFDGLIPLLRVGAVNNNARIGGEAGLGSPTELALLVVAQKAGLEQGSLNRGLPRVGEVPFSANRRLMSTVHRSKRGYYIATKGAPGAALDRCDRIYHQGKIIKLTPAFKKEIAKEISAMSKNALRVLGFAYKEMKIQPKQDSAVESKLIFVGLQGLFDPLRPAVKETVHRLRAEAGIRVVMMTDDYALTAQAIAKEVGIISQVITGAELDELPQGEFEDKVKKISVYARVNSRHKLRIVEALRKQGHRVLATGDKASDVSAIKAADVGVAMGLTGTDAVKEVSDIIVNGDVQLLTIVDAIKEGRGIFGNVRKFVNYLLSVNIAEVLVVLGGVVLLGKLVITAALLLFIRVVTSGLPAIALGSDRAQKDVMRLKPHRFQSTALDPKAWLEMFIFGFMMTSAVLLHYWWVETSTGDLVRAVSVVFTAIVFYEIARLIGVRNIHRVKRFSNPWLGIAVVASILLQLTVLYVPPVAEVFGVAPILTVDWIIILAVALVMTGAMRLVNTLLDWHLNEAEPQYSAEHYENA